MASDLEELTQLQTTLAYTKGPGLKKPPEHIISKQKIWDPEVAKPVTHPFLCLKILSVNTTNMIGYKGAVMAESNTDWKQDQLYTENVGTALAWDIQGSDSL